MNDDIRLKIIYKEAYAFLQNQSGEITLRKQLDYYHLCKPSSINMVFRQMINSLKNKQGYVHFISDLDEMKDILCNFEPKDVFAKYGTNWESLFMEFKKQFGSTKKMDITNKRNSWVMYSRGVLSCAKFLSHFDGIKEFHDFVTSFTYNEFTIASLPMLLEKEIFGFGFPLACDFLKELGYVQYGKPDIHIKDIFEGLKMVDNYSDYEAFKKIVKIGLLVGEDPVIVDKIFWLIGSGSFYEDGKKVLSISRKKSEFITYINSKLNEEDSKNDQSPVV